MQEVQEPLGAWGHWLLDVDVKLIRRPGETVGVLQTKKHAVEVELASLRCRKWCMIPGAVAGLHGDGAAC